MGSEIPFSSCTTISGSYCKIDGDFFHGDGKIEINGYIFHKGIVQHANGKAKFSLGRIYSKFSACVGISRYSDNAKCGVTVGDARFRVNGDNAVLRDWELKRPSNDPTCFNVDVTDVEELILEVDNNGSTNCDFSTWADAKVFKSDESGKSRRNNPIFRQ